MNPIRCVAKLTLQKSTTRRSLASLSQTCCSSPLFPRTNRHQEPGRKGEPPQTRLCRTYYASSPLALPVRRRKRPSQSTSKNSSDSASAASEESVGNNPLQHLPVDDDDEFILAGNALLDKLEESVQGMKAQNDIFVVDRFFSDLGEVLTIDLGPKEGTYRIEMSLEEHAFEYTSPISGKILYILSAQTGAWVGIEDGHIFEGIFVRDLLRQCHGMPNL